jgi:hypothetical protein
VIVAAAFPDIVVLPPDPDCRVSDALAVVDPSVITFAAASLNNWMVLPPPVAVIPPAPDAIVIRPLDPPIVVAAVPEAFIDVVPTDVNVVNVPAADAVPPMAGGDANTALRFEGCTARAVTPGTVAVPATA